MTTKPGVSLQRIGSLPSRSASSNAVSTAAGGRELRAHDLDEREDGRRVEEVHPDDALRARRSRAAISVTESAEVFVARTASSPTTPSSARKSSRLASSSSTIASITRSQPARSASSVVVVRRASAASRSSAVSRPFSTPRPR